MKQTIYIFQTKTLKMVRADFHILKRSEIKHTKLRSGRYKTKQNKCNFYK